ncbi:ABC transporter permease [Bythopirellula polymerisocia]|uniref:ABC-2 family transporter protein n=1 Tax=Bythopirellula polymerisocia TaxID=2528003 RepID=A0A5C6CDB6_9BACT|nr:ABC transporter permease subunit [Bythopirellula polymerisocia]TWU20819.1 ABC-2 family transporter protein [Bythopirellula polymerisocia]
MLPGPIFRVELVTVARRRRYFVLRVIYAALILLVLWTTYSSTSYLRFGTGSNSIRNSARQAAGFFYSFSWLQLLAILAVGPAMAVGTIATERERRTIEYLFATDLSNAEIILGKTFARLTLLGQFVLVGLPILFLFRIMGGIPAQALTASFLITASTAVMLTALSICVSVWSPRARDGTVRIYLLLIVLFLLPAILYGFHQANVIPDYAWDSGLSSFAEFLISINPFAILTRAMGNTSAVGIGLDMGLVMSSVGAQMLVSVFALGLATFAVRRVHLSETTRSAVGNSRLRNLRLPKFRRPLGKRPVLWKEMFSETSTTKFGYVGWIALMILLMSILVMTILVFVNAFDDSRYRSHPTDDYLEYLVGLTGAMGSVILLLLAARAAGLIAQEKERDCWTSLLSTPLSGGEIIDGKQWGNLYSSRWLILVLVFAWLLELLFMPDFIWALLVSGLTFAVLAFYTTNLGLFFSLRSATTMRAMGLTLATIIFCGGGYLFCCCVVFAGGGGSNEMVIFMAPCIPMLLALPTVLYEDFFGGSLWDEGLPIAYCIGIIGYLAAGIGLNLHMKSFFDDYAGRTDSAKRREHNITA